ncbi:hypothetical protein C4588_06285 [Candidatus Parcubacteria bacterium]|jgi:hypothetical protein|nr:MAG: hypothetical protein C4588_06285 [Candidatus Parcubacteria bacterium]
MKQASQKPKKAVIKPKRSKTDAQKVPKKSVSKKTSAVVSGKSVPQCGTTPIADSLEIKTWDTPTGRHPGGRPSDYNETVASIICERLSGGESLTSICYPEDMPSAVTVYAWLTKYPEFLNNYTQARERQAETFIDQCIDIADMTTLDTSIKTTKNGDEYEAPNHEWITRSKLRVETRLKMAEKLYPKKYTPGFKHEVGGKDGGPIEQKWTIEVIQAKKEQN